MQKKTNEVIAFAAFSLLLAAVNPFKFDFSLFILIALSGIISRELLSRRFAQITKNSKRFEHYNNIIDTNSCQFRRDIKRVVRFIDTRTFKKIRTAHRAVIPAAINQCGAISADLCAKKKSNKSTHTQKSGDSSGDGDSDGEPPRLINPQLYDELELAKCLLISKKTLQNLFSKSPQLFPQPIKVPGARGPRWTSSAIEKWINDRALIFESTRSAQHQIAPRRPGRPRIAGIAGGAK